VKGTEGDVKAREGKDREREAKHVFEVESPTAFAA